MVNHYPNFSMHYERAALLSGFDNGVCARIRGEDRQIGSRMTLYLEGKSSVEQNGAKWRLDKL
jgi:hypothetical protein